MAFKLKEVDDQEVLKRYEELVEGKKTTQGTEGEEGGEVGVEGEGEMGEMKFKVAED